MFKRGQILIYICAFFPGALSVSVTPATQSAVIGDNSVVIQCTVSGIPQATSWYWTFSPLQCNNGVSSNPVEGGPSLDGI
jgi:hypothetical protein